MIRRHAEREPCFGLMGGIDDNTPGHSERRRGRGGQHGGWLHTGHTRARRRGRRRARLAEMKANLDGLVVAAYCGSTAVGARSTISTSIIRGVVNPF
jgi:hypothetical protein